MSDTITICFYGSSDHELEVKLAGLYQNDIDSIVDSVLKLQYTNIKIVTGGYGGIMNSIAEKFASKKKDSGKNIEIIGITCDAYDFENPDAEKYNKSNDYSIYNDVIIQSENFTERVQSMIELSDLFIVLPGKQGTLSELLITCESYSFGKYILNGKETKILVHEYWKPILSDVSYFRKFNTDIITFFNSSSFVELIKSYTINSTKQNTFSQIQNATKANWQERMTELKGNICKVILGRVYKEKELLKRLSRDNEFPIHGLDFGWFHIYQGSGHGGEYYSYSTKKYMNLTEEFFDDYNSIMLSNFQKEFEYDYLDGNTNSDENLNYYTGESIPQYNSNKNKSSFSELRNFFNKQKYGQTLIWKGLKTELDGEGQNESDILIFSIFLLLKHRIPRSSIQKINQLLSDFLLKASATKSGELFKEKDKDIINQATRAAISQVMARNTSHNIGAHVMNKLIGDIRNLAFLSYKKGKNYHTNIELKNHLHSDVVKQLKGDKLLKSLDRKSKIAFLHNEIALDQISIFNNYVKCRLDYLADISFGTPLMQTNKYAYADLFKELDKVRLLLEHISGLDNFKFQIKFQKNGKDLDENYDLLVAIPNDILGTQAFYNILENIIRNSAKHSNKSKLDGEDVVFTVNFIDEITGVNGFCSDANCDRTKCDKAHKKEIENALNEFISVEVYDNIPVEKPDEKLDLEESDIKEFNNKKTALPKDNKFSSYIDKLAFSQNKKLNEDILQENKLRSYSLGLVEMDASAAYLRKRPVEYINHCSYDIQYDESWTRNTEKNEKDKIGLRGTNCRHFLKAFKKTEGDKNYLGYRFFLHRPAVVLVVTKEVPANKEELKKQGIWVVTKEEFEKHIKPEYGKKDGKVYPHEFVVIDSSVTFDKVKIEKAEKNSESQETKRIVEIEFLEYYKTSLPIRVLNDISGISELINKSAYAIEMECWKEWANRFEILKNKTIEIAADYNSRVDFSIVFLDHLHSQNNDATNYWNEHKDAYHCEALSTYAQQKLPEFALKSIGEGENKLKNYINKIQSDIIHKNQLLEASISQVIVIDERIQEAAENRDYLKVPFKELYKKMHVIVPDKKDDNLNLSENSFENVKTHVEKYIKAKVKEAKETDFIIIHYSILERMYGKEEINSKLLNELIGESKINVVITSGRGTPDNLPKKVRFVNLSSVITAFVDIRSKYAINYLLNSSRKSNKI